MRLSGPVTDVLWGAATGPRPPSLVLFAWQSLAPTATVHSSHRRALLRGGLPTTDPTGTSVAGRGLKEAPRDWETRGPSQG